MTLKGGEVIVVDTDDKYTTIAIFLSYDKNTKKILCLDTLSKGHEGKHHYNLCHDDKCYILNIEQTVKICNNMVKE